MTTRMTWICHAATGAARPAAFPDDEPIEERGAARARSVASRLRRADRAWTSPALRARQTAEALGLAAAVDSALRDVDCGRWTGRLLADVEAEEPAALLAWFTEPGAAPHGGERILDLLQRVAAWLDAHRDDPRHSIVVAHPAVIRAAVVHAIAATALSFWRIDIAPLSMTVLSCSDRRWRLRSICEGS